VVLGSPDGAGIAELCRSGLLADRSRVRPRRWQLVLGDTADGAVATLPPSLSDILIVGDSGSGKSYVAGLLAEQMIQLGYSVLVVDPEGDHVGLGALPGVLTVGGGRDLPPPSAVAALLRAGHTAVVVDLSHLDAPQQLAYLAALPAEIEVQRLLTGLPHWIILDEAQRTTGRLGPAGCDYDLATKGHCFVTFQPNRLSGETLDEVDAVLALTEPHSHPGLAEVVAHVAGVKPTDVAGVLARPMGDVVLARRDRPGELLTFTPNHRATAHTRHEHKYATMRVDERKGFHFRTGPDRLSGAVAQTLDELEAEIARCPSSVLRHHVPRRDISRWIADVIRDDRLARRIAAVESLADPDSPPAVLDETRRCLLRVLRSERAVGESPERTPA
jgi:hypothetical protein